MKTLCFDVGNTLTSIGLFNGEKLTKTFSILTKDKNYFSVLEALLKKQLKNDKIGDCCISSVVNNLDKKLELIVKKSIEGSIYFVNEKLIPNNLLSITKKARNEIGNDLLCDIVFANKVKNGAKIVFDLGTASKALFINKNNSFFTCFIFPGFEMMLNCLAKGTFKLPKLKQNFNKISKKPSETSDVLWSSTYFSTIGTMKEIINNFKEIVSNKFSLLLCGGYSDVVKKDIKYDFYDKNFTLRGCFEIYSSYIKKGDK